MTPKKSVLDLASSLEGVPILATLPDSPASRAGIRYGDILLEVNGVRTRTWVDYLEAKDLREGGMEVVVFRAGQEATLRLAFEPGRTSSAATVLSEVASLRLFGDNDETSLPPRASEMPKA